MADDKDGEVGGDEVDTETKRLEKNWLQNRIVHKTRGVDYATGHHSKGPC